MGFGTGEKGGNTRMQFHYCPNCGAFLEMRPTGDEGNVPWCPSCERPWFDQFAVCVIALVVNERGEIAILRQRYISQTYGNLVSGYMKPGESAEECARREIQEELGLPAASLEFVRTYWFEKKDMLMVGFFARVTGRDLRLSSEVDSAQWVSVSQALGQVHPAGSISHALVSAWIERKDVPNE